MKFDNVQLILNHRIDSLWEWSVYLWLTRKLVADAVLKSVVRFDTEQECREDAEKLLIELGISMNKNTKRKKAENPGAFQPRKSKKPKVGASAAEITRRIAKERGV